jgi:prepilin-type processing-associated H-X9-DG protein
MMYTQDNKGFYPGPGVGARFDDWIYWNGNRSLDDGRVVPYLGKKFSPKVYTCPSDDTTYRPSGPYRYSYTVNGYICRWWKFPTLKVSQVIRPSTKLLIVDETASTIDDGCWAPGHFDGDQHNIVSNRHDLLSEKRGAALGAADKNYGRGNVIYADGHYEFIERKLSFDVSYWDPLWPNPHPAYP